jgi:hypothetical protein
MVAEYRTEMPMATMAVLVHITILGGVIGIIRCMSRIQRQGLMIRRWMTRIVQLCPCRHRLEHECEHE